MTKKKRILLCTGCSAAILLAAYMGGVLYFTEHFLPGTGFGGTDLSMKDTEEAEEDLEKLCEGYRLTIYCPYGGKTVEEEIRGEDIDLSVPEGNGAEKLLEQQNPFLWPAAFAGGYKSGELPEPVFDQEKLKQITDEMGFVREGKNGPVSSCPEFDGSVFVPSQESYGISQKELEDAVCDCVKSLSPELDLEESGLLKKPERTSESEAVTEACRELNRYCGAQITYALDQDTVVDRQLISGWVTWDKDLNTGIDEAAVKEWVRQLAVRYDTAGAQRSIVTPEGKEAVVSGGTYGWIIDVDTETAALTEDIRSGRTDRREPACIQSAASFGMPDWGEEYVEVDLTRQHMWYIRGGEILLETDVVTGKPEEGMCTPEGVYSILYTQADAVLVGELNPLTGEPGYRQHVDYWMPFTQQGHGFHDADWQWTFGGTVYMSNGSHGCVNMPTDKAGELYEILAAGTPVVIHY